MELIYNDELSYIDDEIETFEDALLSEIESIPEMELDKIIQEFECMNEEEEEVDILEDKINI